MLDCKELILVDEPETQAPVVVYLIADVHYGDPLCDKEGFRGLLNEIAEDPNARVILAGDLLDNATKNSVSDVYNAQISPMGQKVEMSKLLEPIADKILCGVLGNHEARTAKETNQDPMYDIFAKLNIEHRYRREMAFLVVRFGSQGSNARVTVTSDKRPVYSFCVTHGKGNSIYTGSSANAVERFAWRCSGVDLFVTGHTHKPIYFPFSQLVVDTKNKQVREKKCGLVTASSWLSYGGYGAQKILPPTAKTQVKVILSPRGKKFKVEM